MRFSRLRRALGLVAGAAPAPPAPPPPLSPEEIRELEEARVRMRAKWGATDRLLAPIVRDHARADEALRRRLRARRA